MTDATTQDWTKEPWCKEVNDNGEPEIYSKDDEWVAVFPHQCVTSLEKLAHANCNRVFALSEALAGIPDPAAALKRLVAWAREVPCEHCDGAGVLASHHPKCDGTCCLCPVPVLCEWCCYRDQALAPFAHMIHEEGE